MKRWVNGWVGAVVLLIACGKTGGGDSETNWLRSCDADADCGDVGACVCGVCSRDCSTDSECDGALCTAKTDVAACESSSAPGGVCLAECVDTADCRAGFTCRSGSCAPNQAATGGEGGASPRAGSGGQGAVAGSTRGGASGSVGSGGSPPSAEPWDDSHCARPMLQNQPFMCSAQSMREVLRCGEPESYFDANCCRRTECTSDADCPSDARCMPFIALSSGCATTYVTSCSEVNGECGCSSPAACYRPSVCLSAAEPAEDFECPVASKTCEELAVWQSYITIEPAAPPDAAIVQRLSDCTARINQELAARCQ